MEFTLNERVPVSALGDVERFIQAAQHLKALKMQLHYLQCRQSRRQASLAQQIDTFTKHCGELAKGHPRLSDLWKLTQQELALAFAEPAPAASFTGCSTERAT